MHNTMQKFKSLLTTSATSTKYSYCSLACLFATICSICSKQRYKKIPTVHHHYPTLCNTTFNQVIMILQYYNKPLRKLDSAHYDVTGHKVKWYKQTSGRSR